MSLHIANRTSDFRQAARNPHRPQITWEININRALGRMGSCGPPQGFSLGVQSQAVPALPFTPQWALPSQVRKETLYPFIACNHNLLGHSNIASERLPLQSFGQVRKSVPYICLLLKNLAFYMQYQCRVLILCEPHPLAPPIQNPSRM